MGIDQNEAKRRRDVDRPRGSKQPPIAAIEKRVIYSDAFADLAPSSVVVLLLLATNLAKDMNGHIQLSENEAATRGIERKTLRRSLNDLAEHGLIHKTKSGGKMQGHCNKYALCWLPIKNRKGLTDAYLERFDTSAWHRWKKKVGGQKRATASAQNVPLTLNSSPKMSLCKGTKSTHKIISTNTHCTVGSSAQSGGWIPGYLAQLEARGLACHQCFVIPAGRALQ